MSQNESPGMYMLLFMMFSSVAQKNSFEKILGISSLWKENISLGVCIPMFVSVVVYIKVAPVVNSFTWLGCVSSLGHDLTINPAQRETYIHSLCTWGTSLCPNDKSE